MAKGDTDYLTEIAAVCKIKGDTSRDSTSDIENLITTRLGAKIYNFFNTRWRYDAEGTAATATFTFGDTEFDDHNSETITLEDSVGSEKVYTINNEYGASAAREFNAAANAAACAANFIGEVNGANGHPSTITATNPSGAVVVLTQDDAGVSGNTTISHSGNWDALCDVNPPAAFSGGASQHTQRFTIEPASSKMAISGSSNDDAIVAAVRSCWVKFRHLKK